MGSKSSNQPKFVRVTVYISPDEHRLLKSVLALKGLTVSEWFRRMVKKETDDSEDSWE